MGPIAIGVCRDCGGVALDRDRLAMLLEAGSSVLWKLWWKVHERPAPTRTDGACPCPACSAPLVRTAVPGALGHPLLACPACSGLWLGPTDLAELSARAAEAEMDPTWLDEAAGLPRPTEAERIALAAIPQSTACPDCGQPNSAGAPLCWACGHNLTGLCAETACPNCDGVTRKVVAHDVEGRACGFCGAVWLRDGALKSLLFLSSSEQRGVARELREVLGGREARLGSGAQCPDCREEMAPAVLGSFSRTALLTCPGCDSRLVTVGQIEEVAGLNPTLAAA